MVTLHAVLIEKIGMKRTKYILQLICFSQRPNPGLLQIGHQRSQQNRRPEIGECRENFTISSFNIVRKGIKIHKIVCRWRTLNFTVLHVS